MQQLDAELTDLNQLHRGHLRLGIPPMVGHVYARLFRQYRQTYPNVELTVVEYGGRKIEQAILDGDIDVAVTMLSPNQHPDLNTVALDHYPILPWSPIFLSGDHSPHSLGRRSAKSLSICLPMNLL